MASAKKEIMGFEEAIECIDALELKACLQITLDFLKRNNNKCCFPNISPHIEAFLVGLATDTRNLKCKLFDAECEKLASQIIGLLEMNREVFRWTTTYENGAVNKNQLVYKKIFSNKMKIKPVESKKSVSLISQRLILSQSQDPIQTQFDIPTGCKIQLLNATLCFLKSDGEGELLYPDMPTTHAQYMCMLFNSPKSDLNVGFGFKSLYAPLFEAMDEYGMEYELKISFTEKNGDTASLKLEKIRRNKDFVEKKLEQEKLDKSSRETSFENSSRSESILGTNSKESNNLLNISSNSSTSSNRSINRRRRNRLKLTDGVSAGFVADTLQSLIAFTTDVSRASVTFEGLTDREAAFVKGVKTLAGSTSSHDSLEAPLRTSLQQLNSNIATVLETCKIRVEEGHTKTKARFITLKKVPRDNALRKPPSAFKLPTKSRALLAAGAKDISTSKDNLIQFKSAGKLNPSTGEVEVAADEPEPAPEKAPRGATARDNLSKRQAKLLEDMSVPVASDKGKRMMQLMGWAGGALGARGGGILEPILPAIELPAGAGLGHVPPQPAARRLAEFRLALLRGLRGLLLRVAPADTLEFKLPLTRKDKAFLNTAVSKLNKRKCPPAGGTEEQELVKRLLPEMALLGLDVELKAEVSQDLKKVTLTKFKNTQKYPMKLQLSKLKDNDPGTMTVLNPVDCEVVNDDAISQVMATITRTTCKTPVAIKGRAMRMLFLKRFIDVVHGSRSEREFRVVGTMQLKMIAFLENVVKSVNQRVRSSYVADEELGLYDDLVLAARNKDCSLDIVIHSPSKFVLRKMSDRTAPNHNQACLAISACPKPEQGNNNNVKAEVGNNKKVAKLETKCDSKANIVRNESLKDSLKAKEVKILTKSDRIQVSGLVQKGNVKIEKVAKTQYDCDIKHKDNMINSLIEDKDIVKQEIKTDNDDTENSWSTCSENEVDLSEYDTEVKELDKALFKVGFNVRDSDAGVSPTSDTSIHYKNFNAKKTKAKRKNSVVVIAPRSQDTKMHTKIFKTAQTLIWNQIDREDYAVPLLKCHGVQNGGLVYSCHDEKDVAWLKNTIQVANLDLKVFVFADDFVEEKKSRTMAIKINSFMPLDAEKVLSKIELYNDIYTQPWKVLSCESFGSYVIFIVEVDEMSFEFISKENFSLYMGIDKAQFSIIF